MLLYFIGTPSRQKQEIEISKSYRTFKVKKKTNVFICVRWHLIDCKYDTCREGTACMNSIVSTWFPNKVMNEAPHPTCAHPFQWVLPEQQCDEFLGIGRWCIVTLGPIDLIWLRRQGNRSKLKGINQQSASGTTFLKKWTMVVIIWDLQAAILTLFWFCCILSIGHEEQTIPNWVHKTLVLKRVKLPVAY